MKKNTCTRARKFLQDININSDVIKTLDHLVKERLQHHLVKSPNTGVQCINIMLECANAAASRINDLGPETQVAFLLGYGSSEHDLTNNLNSGVSSHQQAREFLERVEFTDRVRDELEQLVLDSFRNIADTIIDDIEDGNDKEGIINFLHKVAKQNADYINWRGPQYQVPQLLLNGIHEDNLQVLIRMEGARKHAEMQDDSPDPEVPMRDMTSGF